MKPKTIRIWYWSVTILFSLAMIADAIGGITQQKQGQDVLIHLGYPLYIMPMYGVAKLLGAIAIIQPKFRAIKEWAYAGFAFNFISAFLSRLIVGDSISFDYPAFGVATNYVHFLLFLEEDSNTNCIAMEDVDAKNIIDEAFEAINELIVLLNGLTEKEISMIPFKDSWSAGQLAQHMVMANTGLIKLINGPVDDANRNPQAHISTIEEIFLNFDSKLKSPGPLVPPQIHYDKIELVEMLVNISNDVKETHQIPDLTKICLAFEVPVFGYLTGIECLDFIRCHTKRHVHQLKKIISYLI